MTRFAASLAALLLVVGLAACSSRSGAVSARPTVAPTGGPPTTPASPATPVSSGGLGDAEIGCDFGGHDDAYHIHTLVGVRVDGQLYAPPPNIGITDCMYWVHTHKADGIVHVEAPADVSPTVGDFLDIWQETYPDDELLASAREAIAAGEVTVDDQPYPGDVRALPLADKLRVFLGS